MTVIDRFDPSNGIKTAIIATGRSVAKTGTFVAITLENKRIVHFGTGRCRLVQSGVFGLRTALSGSRLGKPVGLRAVLEEAIL